ncbi:MAG: hydroxyphenylacetyl-CoA thioesterase PaaI [Actinomycetota bacterium]
MSDAPDPVSELLGIEVVEVSAGHAILKAEVLPAHLNQHGTAHGGFMFALADTALAVAANSHGPEAVALAASIHFTRPARPGEVLVAEAREVSRTTRSGAYEIMVRSGEDLVALFTGTVFRKA